MKRLSFILLCSIMLVTACGTVTEGSKNENQNTEENHSEKKNEGNEQLVISMNSLMNADETLETEFEYTVAEDGVCIYKYIGDSTIVVIPNKIEGVEVVKISDNAFANMENIQAIRVSDTVVDLSGSSIFGNCTNLRFLVIGKNVEVIGEYCIVGCTNLEEIQLNSNLKRIDSYGLYTASDKLKEIHVPESVVEMGEGALNDFSVIYVKAGSYAEEYMKSYTSAVHDYVVE